MLAAAGDRHGAAGRAAKLNHSYAAKDAVFLVGSRFRAGRARGAADRAGAGIQAEADHNQPGVGCAHEDLAGAFVPRPHSYTRITARSAANHSGGGPSCRRQSGRVEQYPHVEAPVLAARGGLALVSLRWWDDAGNQRTSLDVLPGEQGRRTHLPGPLRRGMILPAPTGCSTSGTTEVKVQPSLSTA